MGDQTDDGTEAQWIRADVMKDTIQAAGIPFLAVPGNHDYDGAGSVAENRAAGYFTTRYATQGTGRYEDGRGDNWYYLFSSSGQDFIVLGLEFGPRQAVVDWASALLTTYASRKAIMVTHAYMYDDGTTIGTGDAWNPKTLIDSEDVHDGDDLWTELISQHANIIQVWSGHEAGFLYRLDQGAGTGYIVQILNAHGPNIGNIGLAQYYLDNNMVFIQQYSTVNGASLTYNWDLPIV